MYYAGIGAVLAIFYRLGMGRGGCCDELEGSGGANMLLGRSCGASTPFRASDGPPALSSVVGFYFSCKDVGPKFSLSVLVRKGGRDRVGGLILSSFCGSGSGRRITFVIFYGQPM